MTRRRMSGIPQTDAEVHAWWWGARLCKAGNPMMTNLAYHKTDPGELLDADERASWDRLGPRHFWLWAMTGYTAEARAEDDIP